MKSLSRLRLLSWGALLCATTIGCGRDYTAVCEEQVDCADGNERDVEACVVEFERQEEQADIYGCSEWYDLNADCFEERAECDNGVYGLEDADDCESEREDLVSCLSQ
ncbi:MAG: hypothetical protein AAGA56_30435 [Myxococcota bacterium]